MAALPRHRPTPALLALLLALCGQPTSVCAAQPAFSRSENHFDARDGETLYRSVCQGCHMPQGQGAVGAGTYPELAADPRLAAAAYPAMLVLNGSGAMPGFAAMMDDEQVANVVNYLRTHFGNAYADAISTEQVRQMRKPQH
jgi:mono/diheme cytochrome c family protein